ncbi:YfkD famly protein [Bacillus fonticola]|uniref:YfkD famly protein n=1 Tax=Bacillus fonticola TaxID=2728853 RepID=UPI001D13B32E|nr:YfkD famly protein [Bacillus fonticola]
MKTMIRAVVSLFVLFSILVPVTPVALAEKGKEKEEQPDKQEQVEKEPIAVPNSVVNLAKENTYPNPTQDLPYLQPSELTKELINSSNEQITNPRFIRMLNESNVNKTPFAIGLRATIYLGDWALSYESKETSPNWEFQQINTNQVDNRGGKTAKQTIYTQEVQKRITGSFTSKVKYGQDVRQMMLLSATEDTQLPLSFDTIIGAGTKGRQTYSIPPKRLGYLYAYAPVVNEKGTVTYGEVYVVLKGHRRSIVVKNVTRQGVSAYIPVQDHVTFGFVTSERPR